MLTKNDSIKPEMETASPAMDARPASIKSVGRGLAQFLVMALVLFLGFTGMNYFTSLREPPPTRPPFQTVYTVDTAIAERGLHQPQLLVYGEVQAASSVDLRSLVTGEVVSVNPAVKAGGRVEEGEKLFSIDPFTFEQERALAEANLAETAAKIEENQARIRIEESRIRSWTEQLEIAQTDLNRISALRENGTATAKQVEDRSLIVSQRRQSLEQAELNLVAEKSRLRQLDAIMARFRLNKEQAERNIEDTVMRAPLTGVINAKDVAVGRMINANDIAISMYRADQLEVRFTLTDQRFARIQNDNTGIIGRPVEVIWVIGGEEFRYPAVIDRIGARIASDRGGVEVIALIDQDLSGTALRPGAFVEIIVPDRAFDGYFKAPDTALYGNDTVYEIVDGALVATKVSVRARDGDQIIFDADLANGAEILTTRIAEISEGLRVRSRGDVEASTAARTQGQTGSETQ